MVAMLFVLSLSPFTASLVLSARKTGIALKQRSCAEFDYRYDHVPAWVSRAQ